MPDHTNLRGLRVGYALCGSFCTFARSFEALENLLSLGCDVTGIMSYNAYDLDTRFGAAESHRARLRALTDKPIIHDITAAEPIGPKRMFDILAVAPCTGNTLAKLAAGIIDTPVCMAVKSHLRSQRPVVLAVSTNDGLSAAAKNIGALLNLKHFYFVPMKQDDPAAKPFSLAADLSLLPDTIQEALDERQIQPILR